MATIDEENALLKLRDRMESQFEKSQAERQAALKELKTAVSEFAVVKEQARQALRRSEAVLQLKR